MLQHHLYHNFLYSLTLLRTHISVVIYTFFLKLIVICIIQSTHSIHTQPWWSYLIDRNILIGRYYFTIFVQVNFPNRSCDCQNFHPHHSLHHLPVLVHMFLMAVVPAMNLKFPL
jgi:hypothetical protein